MKKVIRDGKVAVLYSPGYGAGWSTWGAPEDLIFDPEIVALVEADKREQINILVSRRGYDFYDGGASKLAIVWLPVGTKFVITEYDGSEGIKVIEEIDFYVA